MGMDESRNNPMQVRTLIVTALGLSIFIWEIAFNLGVHGVIFYYHLHMLWVAASVVLLCVLMGDVGIHNMGRWGVFALASPTIWFILNALTPSIEISWFNEMLWVVALAVFVIATPYILYVVFELVENDFFSLSVYHRQRLIMIVMIVAATGYAVGELHEWFVTCEQFEVAGEFIPENCYSHIDELEG